MTLDWEGWLLNSADALDSDYSQPAKLKKAMANYGAAIELYESAHAGMTELLGDRSPQAEVVLRALADAHHKAGHFDVAHDYCLQALEQTREARGTRYALGCHLLARILSSIGDYAGAAAANEEANMIPARSKDASPDSMVLYAANISQGAAYQVRQGDIAEGIALQRKALKLRRRYLPPNDLAIAESLSHLAGAEMAAGHPRRARRYLRKVLAMHKRQGRRQPARRPRHPHHSRDRAPEPDRHPPGRALRMRLRQRRDP